MGTSLMYNFIYCQYILNREDVARGKTRRIIQCDRPTVNGLSCDKHKFHLTYYDYTKEDNDA